MQTPVYSIIIGVLQFLSQIGLQLVKKQLVQWKLDVSTRAKGMCLYCTTIVFIENEYLYMY